MSELSLENKLDQEHSDLCIENMNKAFPPGPLDNYRKQASFDWFQMKVFIDGGEDVVRFKQSLWNTLEKDPLFDRTNDSKLSFDERRQLTMKRCIRVAEYNFLTDYQVMGNPMLAQAFNDTLGAYDWSLSAKYLLNRTVSVLIVSASQFSVISPIFLSFIQQDLTRSQSSLRSAAEGSARGFPPS